MLPVFDPGSKTTARSQPRAALISDAAATHLATAFNVRGFVDSLLGGGLAQDAVRAVAAALPRRYALAWACECFQEVKNTPAGLGDEDRAGLALAERWLRSPTEEHRRVAASFAANGEYASPGCWLAAAAAWSEGSIGPADLASPIPPPPSLCGEALAAALILLATLEPETRVARLDGFARHALALFGSGGAKPEPAVRA